MRVDMGQSEQDILPRAYSKAIVDFKKLRLKGLLCGYATWIYESLGGISEHAFELASAGQAALLESLSWLVSSFWEAT